MLPIGVALLLAALVSASAGPVEAQQLRGRLLDLQSDEPIPVGMVTLRTVEGETVAAAVTDSLGNWRLAVPAPGRYLVAARRIGFQPWVAGPLQVSAGDDLFFHFHLRRLPPLLTPSQSIARSTQRNLELAGFYERQRADFGHFLTPEAIARRGAARISDLLRGVPGVRLVTTAGSAGGEQIQLRAGSLSPGGVCRPRVFVDGVVFTRGDARRPSDDEVRAQSVELAIEDELQEMDQALRIDDIGPASDIAAIEVYRSSAQVPVQFGGPSIETSCGVIVIWTRRGTPRSAR